MGALYKKLISVTLIFALLINSNAGAFAQLLKEDKAYIPLKREIKTILSESVKSNTVVDDKYIRRAYKKEYNFHRLFESLNKQGLNKDYDEVCDGEICAPYHTFMRGAIGALIDFSKGEGEVLSEFTEEIKEAVYLGAVGSADIEPLREGLIEGSKKKLEFCSTRKADYKKEDECQKGLNGLLILGVLWGSEKAAKENADTIYKALKNNIRTTYSAMVLPQGIAALSYMDTDYSYSLIEKFLTKDSIPGIREGLSKELDLFTSPQGVYNVIEAGISRDYYKNRMRYLNMNSERWSYINEEETSKAGLDPKIIASQGELLLDKDHADTSYNIVYGNILTDIGEFLVQSNERGKKLGDKLLDGFINNNKVVHLPLMLGLVKGKDGAHDIKASLAARKLNEAFYYDTNGGTGKYIAKASAIKGSGLVWNRQNVVSYEYYKTRIGVERFSFFADIIISAIFLGTFILSVPSIMKGIYKLGKLAKLSIKGKAVKAGRLVKKKPAAKPTKPEVKATAPKTEPKAAAQPKTNVKPTTSKAEGALNRIISSKSRTAK